MTTFALTGLTLFIFTGLVAFGVGVRLCIIDFLAARRARKRALRFDSRVWFNGYEMKNTKDNQQAYTTSFWADVLKSHQEIDDKMKIAKVSTVLERTDVEALLDKILSK